MRKISIKNKTILLLVYLIPTVVVFSVWFLPNFLANRTMILTHLLLPLMLLIFPIYLLAIVASQTLEKQTIKYYIKQYIFLLGVLMINILPISFMFAVVYSIVHDHYNFLSIVLDALGALIIVFPCNWVLLTLGWIAVILHKRKDT